MQLTASTRKRDVFPAFCRPIMVISISVALFHTPTVIVIQKHLHYLPLPMNMNIIACDKKIHAAVYVETGKSLWQGTYQNNRKSQS